jgi:membrane associated rhomboid family serine protease
VFIPVGDDNPREKVPVVTIALILLNGLIFFLWCGSEEALLQSVPVHALYPAQVDWLSPEWWKDVFTSMFMHANWIHLLGNMIFLWIFGDNIEDKIGPVLFSAFYLVCGVAAVLLHVYTTDNPDIPILGASGAVSGVLGAYVLFFPIRNVHVFVFPLGFMKTPAVVWIGWWFVQQFYFARMQNTGVAWYAHIGGFAAGALIALPLRVAFNKRFQPKKD